MDIKESKANYKTKCAEKKHNTEQQQRQQKQQQQQKNKHLK